MDLVKLQKNCVLVPTPGQTEQEYLGEYLMQKKICLCIEQNAFSLYEALQQAAAFEYADMNTFDMEFYRTIVEDAIRQKAPRSSST
jgi:hypothetical protein